MLQCVHVSRWRWLPKYLCTNALLFQGLEQQSPHGLACPASRSYLVWTVNTKKSTVWVIRHSFPWPRREKSLGLYASACCLSHPAHTQNDTPGAVLTWQPYIQDGVWGSNTFVVSKTLLLLQLYSHRLPNEMESVQLGLGPPKYKYLITLLIFICQTGRPLCHPSNAVKEPEGKLSSWWHNLRLHLANYKVKYKLHRLN